MSKIFQGDGFFLEIIADSPEGRMWYICTETKSILLTEGQLRELLMTFCAYQVLGVAGLNK